MWFPSHDPVWREEEKRPSLKSLSRHRRIIMTDNISNIYSWRQDRGRITGHPVIAANHITHYDTMIRKRHLRIDGDSEIHNTILRLAKDHL